MPGLHVGASDVPYSDIAPLAVHQGVQKAVETVLGIARAGEVQRGAVKMHACRLWSDLLQGQFLCGCGQAC